MVTVTRAEALHISNTKGALAKIAQIFHADALHTNDLNAITRTAPKAIRDLIVEELQGASEIYKKTIEKARVKTGDDVAGIHSLPSTLFHCLRDNLLDEMAVRACFETFKKGVRAIPQVKANDNDIVQIASRSGLLLVFLSQLTKAWVRILWKTPASTARTVLVTAVTQLQKVFGFSRETAKLVLHVGSFGAFDLSDKMDITKPTLLRTFVAGHDGDLLSALFTVGFWIELKKYLAALKVYIPTSQENTYLGYIVTFVLSLLGKGAGKIGTLGPKISTLIMPKSMIFCLLIQVSMVLFYNNSRVRQVARSFILTVLRVLLCKPTSAAYTFLKKRLFKKKNQNSCPRPSSVFTVTVEPTNKNLKGHRKLVAISPHPILFIVTQASKDEVITPAQRDHIELLVAERDGPEHRGARTYMTTEDELVDVGLDVPNMKFPYAVMYDRSGKRIHASRSPRLVFDFLKKSAANFGLTVNKIKRIRNIKYPNKSLHNVLNIRYTALKGQVKPAATKNLNRAYKATTRKL